MSLTDTEVAIAISLAPADCWDPYTQIPEELFGVFGLIFWLPEDGGDGEAPLLFSSFRDGVVFDDVVFVVVVAFAVACDVTPFWT